MISTNGLFELTEEQVSTELSGESVILNHLKGTYYNLNETGSFVWVLLESGPKSFLQLRDGLMAEFDVSREILTQDLKELLIDLKNEGLIREIE